MWMILAIVMDMALAYVIVRTVKRGWVQALLCVPAGAISSWAALLAFLLPMLSGLSPAERGSPIYGNMVAYLGALAFFGMFLHAVAVAIFVALLRWVGRPKATG